MESHVLAKRKVLSLAFCFLLLSFSPGPIVALPIFFDNSDDASLINSIIEEMTDEELISQVFFLGYHGEIPSHTIKQWITQKQIGGVKIFTRNVSDLKTLAQSIKEMQEFAATGRFQIPLFIATDQEGGWIRHVKHETSETPGNLALGASGLPHDAFLTGYYIGFELRALGINMNFSPTTDVYSNPNASVIGPRAFSTDPVETAVLSVAYFRGMQKAGIIATAKHFPGHGDASKDSHGHLPIILADYETLWRRELVPYRFLIKEGLPAIMTGHLAFPNILDDTMPSSVSAFFQQEILREKLGFMGITITDDMEMAGVLIGNDSISIACYRALESGNDMILISHTPSLQKKTWEYLLTQIRQNPLFKQKIIDSVRRILTLKIQTFKGKNAFPILPDVKQIHNQVPHEEATLFFFESACRSVTRIKSKHIPYQPKKHEKVIAIGQFETFIEEARIRFPLTDTYMFGFYPFYRSTDNERAYIPKLSQNYDTVLFCVANFNSLDILNYLEEIDSRIIVISALSPVYLMDAEWVETAIAVYGMGRDSFRAGFAVLSGDFESEGTLPIDFLE